MKVRFRPAAEADLDALFDFLLAEVSARAAGDYVRRVHAACMSLESFPSRGAPRPELGVGVRILGFERRVAIAYETRPDAVVILAVLYGGRDVQAILDDR